MRPQLKSYLVYFLTGGIFTVLIVALEENGSRLLSGFATLMPIFTLVAYLAPGIGSKWAIGAGLLGFFILAAAYLLIVHRYNLFGET